MGQYSALIDELADEIRRRPDAHLFGHDSAAPRSRSKADDFDFVPPDQIRAAAAKRRDQSVKLAKSLSALDRAVSHLPTSPPVRPLTRSEKIGAARLLRDTVLAKAMDAFRAGQLSGSQVRELEILSNEGLARFARVAR